MRAYRNNRGSERPSQLVVPLVLEVGSVTHPARELHIQRAARERYQIRDSLYALSGNVILADLQAIRVLAQRMNQDRDLAREPHRAVRTGDLNAMGLIDEILHHVVDLYRQEHGHSVVADALAMLEDRFGAERVDRCLAQFSDQFPPSSVFRGDTSIDGFLAEVFEGRSGREIVLEELLMLWLENRNPAFGIAAELFADAELEERTGYREMVDAVAEFFVDRPPFGPDELPLVEMLREPSVRFPDSLANQLAYIRERWGTLLGNYLFRLLRGLDVLREDARPAFAGPGPSRIYRYDGADPERFSPDRDWMPNVVVIAKSTLVWLDQLSRTYRREVSRLDQIPDEELDRIASFGFNGIWLIGLWQRSAASRRIKNIMGNPEAEASAYALYDYEVADELGGWEALDQLRGRCAARGIRLASDMVPNHTGIDGRWVIDHPDWFVQLDHPPFPAYSFGGENLSSNPGVGIYLEDHYYSRSDAAVVFRRTDLSDGRTRYIYHGNDGTSMPWNDTAQLDFLNAEVREAVIQTILHVARNFPIIRFDAAMTLARKHVQRLWFPQPGSGGDIASRSEHGLTQAAFDAAMPEEFWRQVVDRVAAEVPDTLLLAEAFWMMEGYFVRTLGMHRVYNSAFMNMLKSEENAKYRQTVKNTLEFDRDILKRFVNFMNNPDEETAVAQFGTGDKYIGCCTLMVTMPGLPMFGHGQIEGFTEKYGMEYRRAYVDERPDRELVARHEREIFPLMRRRELWSGVEHFLLYDLYTENGSVNENVYAYSNRRGDERGLVLYNNAYERAWGWIRQSASYVEKLPGGRREHRRADLADALGLDGDYDRYCVFRDSRSGLWFFRRSTEVRERGLFVELSGYQCHVFIDFHEVADNQFGHYAQLTDQLAGRGVQNVEDALREVALRPLLDLFGTVVNSQTWHLLHQGLHGTEALDEPRLRQISENYRRVLALAHTYRPLRASADDAIAALERGLTAAEDLAFLNLETPRRAPARYRKAAEHYARVIRDRADRRDLAAAWLLLRPLGVVYESATGICEEWGLIGWTSRAFQADTGAPGWVQLVKVLLEHGDWLHRHAASSSPAAGLVRELLADAEVTGYLGLHEYEGEVWFNKERFDDLAWWLYFCGLIALLESGDGGADPADRERAVTRLYAIVEELGRAEAASGYRIEALLSALGAGRTDGAVER